MNNCLFCKITEGVIDSKKVYEDDSVLAILDADPIAPGHTLIIPKKHCENILELPDEELTPFFKGVKSVIKILDEKLNPDGFTHGINHKVGQAIDHLHFHVVPRWENDGGSSLHGVVSNSPKEPLDNILEKISQ